MQREHELIEYQSWLSGMYVAHAIGCNFSKHASYPDNPLVNRNKEETVKGMTDGEHFAMFAMKHNAQIKKERGK